MLWIVVSFARAFAEKRKLRELNFNYSLTGLIRQPTRASSPLTDPGVVMISSLAATAKDGKPHNPLKRNSFFYRSRLFYHPSHIVLVNFEAKEIRLGNYYFTYYKALKRSLCRGFLHRFGEPFSRSENVYTKCGKKEDMFCLPWRHWIMSSLFEFVPHVVYMKWCFCGETQGCSRATMTGQLTR